MRLNLDKHFRIKIGNKSFARFDVAMTSFSSDKKKEKESNVI